MNGTGHDARRAAHHRAPAREGTTYRKLGRYIPCPDPTCRAEWRSERDAQKCALSHELHAADTLAASGV
jgi:hypothetical protein